MKHEFALYLFGHAFNNHCPLHGSCHALTQPSAQQQMASAQCSLVLPLYNGSAVERLFEVAMPSLWCRRDTETVCIREAGAAGI